ncbi:Transmembrane_domain-containing protein [Hexamita inflata]|uniref:Transmembrane domain-containing protein n=1 Tax=Hexamita inflata TaxID=28002 RepID=A0AA86P6D6_9EUKA|nr:Transmembrane domain-containing protein [Hexamita inflata]
MNPIIPSFKISLGGIIGGSVLGSVLTVVLLVGTVRQHFAKQVDSSLFGEFPVASIVFHIIITVFVSIGIVFTGSTTGSALIGVGCSMYFLKVCSICCCNPELEAFRNKRTASETDQFLQKMRQTMPKAWFSIECYHMHTYTTTDSKGNTTTHTEKVVTYRETRYINITGVVDSTPALYLVGSAPLILLSLREQISWIGNSQNILNALKAKAYDDNRYRDTHCSVDFSIHVPGLTAENFLQRGSYPAWINANNLRLSILFQYDCLYLGFMRSVIPHTYLPIVKACSLEKYESNNQPDIQPQINQVQLPVLDEFFTIHENQITLPQILEENNQPLITDIRPDYLDSFHQIKPLVYDTYTGPLQHQPTNTNELVLQPATVENKLII